MQGRPRSACKGGCLATGAGSQPGPRRRGPHRRGVAPGAVGSLPAGRWRPEAGRSHRTATRMEIRCWLIVCGMSGQRGVGGELGWLPPVHTRAALLTAVPPASASSTFCAARPPTREASAACHVGLNYEHCTVCKGCGMWLRLTLQQHRPRSASRLSVTFSWEGNQPPKSDRDRQTEVVYESIVLSVFLQDKYVASRARNALPHQRPEP